MWLGKMYLAHTKQWKKNNDGKNGTAKSKKNQNV